jgi:hypothetical protein
MTDYRCPAVSSADTRCVKMVTPHAWHMDVRGGKWPDADRALYGPEKPFSPTAADLDGVAHNMRGPHPWIPGATFHMNPGLAEDLADFLDAWHCVCNIGVQECERHPGRLFTIDQRFASERAWDARVVKP